MKFEGLSRAVAVMVWSSCLGALLAQGSPALTAGQAAPTAPSASSQVQPGLRPLKQSLDTLTVDRWKASKAVKEQTTTNVGSIRHDLEDTLPGLLSAADAAPTSVAAMLPVTRNLSALYDVVLRVTVVAEAAAPQAQTMALESALNSLDDARRKFSDRVQGDAEAQERQVAALQKQVATLMAPPPAAAATPVTEPAPVPVKKKRRVIKKTPPPATPPSGM